jgi:sugar lactone lactonase YvrE
MHLKTIHVGFRLAFAVAVTLVFSSCGGGDSTPPTSVGSSPPPPSAPVGEIVFPSTQTFTEAVSLTVLGTASVAAAETPLKVNGVDATTSDGFTHWSVRVPLATGLNELTLTTRGGIVLDRTPVESDANLVLAEGITFDPNRNRVLVVASRAIVAIDPATGARSAFSNATVPDAMDPLVAPIDADVDPSSDRAVVLNIVAFPTVEPPNPDWIARITTVDLATGERTHLPPLLNVSPVARLAVDAVNDRALLVGVRDPPDPTRVGVLGINLTTGQTSAIADFPFSTPVDIAVDAPRNRALVVDNDYSLVWAVDLATGERSGAFSFGFHELPAPIAVDETHSKMFFSGLPLSGGLSEIDLVTLNRRTILEAPRKVYGLAVDPGGNRLFAIEDDGRVITAIDLNDRRASTLMQWHLPEERPVRGVIGHPTIDSDGNRVLAMGFTTEDNPFTQTTALIAIDLTTRRSTSVSMNTSPPPPLPGTFPPPPLFLPDDGGVAVQNEQGRALVINADIGEVLAVDLDTGERTLFSRFVGSNINSSLQDMVLDGTRSRALVSNQMRSETLDGVPQFVGAHSIIEIDLTSGEGRLFSGPSMPDAANPFFGPTHIALDVARHRLLVADGERIVAVDLTSGHRSVFATFTGSIVRDIEVDAVGRRILVGGVGVALDAQTGAPTAFPFPVTHEWIATDPGGRIFVLDGYSLSEVNRLTGEQVILTR